MKRRTFVSGALAGGVSLERLALLPEKEIGKPKPRKPSKIMEHPLWLFKIGLSGKWLLVGQKIFLVGERLPNI